MKRRTFLKIAGMGSVSFAAGCTSDPENFLYTLVNAPDDMVTGRADWYASTCRECPAGCGILAKNREGRVIKLEGNPLHPINRGSLCMRGQAALQGVYHPDRIVRPLLKTDGGWQPMAYGEALSLIKDKARAAKADGQGRVRMLTEVVGDTRMALFGESMKQLGSTGPTVFEPFAYESLKTANDMVFGIEGLPAYRMKDADLLISFGADFLETWLSPVEYARQFKATHAFQGGTKHLFFSVGPYQSLSAANADQWISCRPGTETMIVFGLLRSILDMRRETPFDESFRSFLSEFVRPFSKERVVETSGIFPEQFERLLDGLTRARRPLVLGSGAAASAGGAVQTDIGVNLLNLVLDPELTRIDFRCRHRIEQAAKRSDIIDFFRNISNDSVQLLLLNHVNPVFAMPACAEIKSAMEEKNLFKVSFTNFMDDTARLADLIFPVRLPLESWDEYAGKTGMMSTLQPAMGRLTQAPDIGDVFLDALCVDEKPAANYKEYLIARLNETGQIRKDTDWVKTIGNGGDFIAESDKVPSRKPLCLDKIQQHLGSWKGRPPAGLAFCAAPTIRFFDGRGANLPWLCEVPDSMTQIAWQTPVVCHPETLAQHALSQGDEIEIASDWGKCEAPVYESQGVFPGVLMMGIGQGHQDYGRYARHTGANPLCLMSPETETGSGGHQLTAEGVSIRKTGRSVRLAHTDGSRIQHGRKIALSATPAELTPDHPHEPPGLTMDNFPLTLPIPEGYHPSRDLYPPHDHAGYRWSMVVDLDRCIGCNACAVACYAENNIGIVGEERIIQGREMSWLRVERYHDPDRMEKITFLPMLCQHCDNAPCEAVCPVYAPHHSKEGTNNQIYNRCIGTRFCAQNCPYKVRRFNWFTWEWPEPLNRQLNPNVTVRSKGVMEKCSFCIQRIKSAHSIAKNEKRGIRDGEVIPACVQTCPTGALAFGNLMDEKSRVRRLVEDPRAYQVMGYLNTKPAVIYLKKVIQDI
jgi:Fe-S-cluster-containing dehydrogenase component